jgi:hypothetical protein
MSTQKSPPPTFGFLTVVEQNEWGIMGGLLVVNAGGRPCEFHCTAPVKATRTQEILYGRTLKPFLCGEQIGPALMAKAKTEPLVVFTNHTDLITLRDFISVPVVLVDVNHYGDVGEENLHAFELGKHRVAIENRYSTDQTTVCDQWRVHAISLDLTEPFERIRNALEEAQKAARPVAA